MLVQRFRSEQLVAADGMPWAKSSARDVHFTDKTARDSFAICFGRVSVLSNVGVEQEMERRMDRAGDRGQETGDEYVFETRGIGPVLGALVQWSDEQTLPSRYEKSEKMSRMKMGWGDEEYGLGPGRG